MHAALTCSSVCRPEDFPLFSVSVNMCHMAVVCFLFWEYGEAALLAETEAGNVPGSRPVSSVGRGELGMWRGPSPPSASMVGHKSML